MRKSLLLILMLLLTCVLGVNASKKYADLSRNQTHRNGTWTADTKTFAWTKSYDAYMELTGLFGDLSDYTSLVLEIANFTSSFRVDFVLDNGDIIKGAYGDKGTAFGSGTSPKVINLSKSLSADQLKEVKGIRLNTNSASGSVTINKAYLVKPLTALNYVNGVATLDLTDLKASGNGITYDDQTGKITSTGTSGNLSVDLPTDGIDLSEASKITVDCEGNIMDCMVIKQGSDTPVSLYTSKYGLDFTTNANFKDKDRSAVTEISWIINKAGTMTFKSVKFTKGFSAITVGENQYATFVTTDILDFSKASGLKAYSVTFTDGKISYRQISGKVPANTAILVYADVAGKFTIPLASTATAITNDLQGSATDSKEADGTQYILAKDSEGLGWYQVEVGTNIPAGKGYLVIRGNAAKSFYPIDNTTTGIVSVDNRLSENSGQWYNIAGQRVSKSYKGIIVKEGRKYINR